MKNLILLFAFFFGYYASNAQDTCCQKLINLQNIQKGKKYSLRGTAKSSVNNWVCVTETDTLSNTYFYSTFDVIDGHVKTEQIFCNHRFYRRKNDEKWQLIHNELESRRNYDSIMLNLTQQQKQSILAHNCQQLEDEIINGEKCFVFSVERERPIPKPKREISKISTSNTIKSITKEWYNDQGFLIKTESKTKNSLNIETTMYTTYEYNIDIPIIKEPVIKR